MGFFPVVMPKEIEPRNYPRKLRIRSIIKQKNILSVYGSLLILCEEQGIQEPGYFTFTKKVHNRSTYEQTKARQGRRAAYQYKKFYWESSRTTPRHGDRHDEICHIDRTEADIELVSSETGHNLARPWLTLLKHHQLLQSICSNCDRAIPLLSGNSRIGYCSNCEAWLGNIAEISQSTIANQSEIDFSDIWTTKTLGEFIAFIPQANYSIGKNNISQALKQAIDITHQGNIAAFARTFRLPKNTVWMWCKGKSKPELKVILQICYCLDISFIDLLV